MSDYLIQFNNISKFFGKVIALKDVTMKLKKGEIMCLLGDNGAGKSTLIKTLAGVHKPDEGEIIVEDKKTIFDGPKDALDMGIATVYQDLALVSLMSVTRNFFMGREPLKGPPLFKTFDIEKANKIAAERMGQIGGKALKDFAEDAFKRAGADGILTYFAKEIAEELNNE